MFELIINSIGIHINYRPTNFQVTAQGQVIGAVVAVDQWTAQHAARCVKVEYKGLEPVIITLEVKRQNSMLFVFLT
jgi:CO/xanthine dehydrogenase Mo-binding subunit